MVRVKCPSIRGLRHTARNFRDLLLCNKSSKYVIKFIKFIKLHLLKTSYNFFFNFRINRVTTNLRQCKM